MPRTSLECLIPNRENEEGDRNIKKEPLGKVASFVDASVVASGKATSYKES